MLIRCPYPDCFFTYDLAIPGSSRFILTRSRCPNCQKEGTAASLEICSMLQERAKLNRQRPPAGQQFQVLLENVRSLWNVGSIFRTADAVGADILYLCGITGCPPKRQITKTALGAEQFVPWQYFAHALDIIPQLKEQGICILGLERNQTSANLATFLKEKKFSKPLCLVIGNENQGLSPETLHYCDYVCGLPMQGKKESLNAAVAFGVATYLINEFTS